VDGKGVKELGKFLKEMMVRVLNEEEWVEFCY